MHASLEVAAKIPRSTSITSTATCAPTVGTKTLSQSLDKGSLYLKFADDEPPSVDRDRESRRSRVTVSDLLTGGEELVIAADLVVLVTGMVPRPIDELIKALKLPVGKDGFLHEIHPKLRPVETVVDGVFICGTCQGPKNSAESVASGLAAVTQSAWPC